MNDAVHGLCSIDVMYLNWPISVCLFILFCFGFCNVLAVPVICLSTVSMFTYDLTCLTFLLLPAAGQLSVLFSYLDQAVSNLN